MKEVLSKVLHFVKEFMSRAQKRDADGILIKDKDDNTIDTTAAAWHKQTDKATKAVTKAISFNSALNIYIQGAPPVPPLPTFDSTTYDSLALSPQDHAAIRRASVSQGKAFWADFVQKGTDAISAFLGGSLGSDAAGHGNTYLQVWTGP